MTTVPACPLDQPDYPAAHSMDTTWFAVDGKGQVGCFTTGDDGVVPATWFYLPRSLWRDFLSRRQSAPGDCELFQDLLLQSARAAGEKLVTNQGTTASDRQTWSTNSYLQDVRSKPWLAVLGPEPEGHAPSMVPTLAPSWCADYGPMLEGYDCWGLVLVMRRLFPLGPDFHGTEIFLDSERRVLLVERMPAALYRRMHEERACLGCFVVFDQPYRLGFFCYSRNYRHHYRRTDSPADPLRIDQLPEALREYLALVRLAATHFDASLSVDLEGHVLCVEYGESFWSFDDGTQTVRLSVSDQDDYRYGEYLRQYRDAYPQLAAWASSQDYAIESPPG